MSEYVKKVNEGDFDQVVLKSTTPVLVDFWAEWCGPCRALAPTVEAIAEQYSVSSIQKVASIGSRKNTERSELSQAHLPEMDSGLR